MLSVDEAVEQVIEAFFAVGNSRLIGMTGTRKGVRYNLLTALTDLRVARDAALEEQKRLAEAPERLAEDLRALGWHLEPPILGKRLRATKELGPGQMASRSGEDAEALLELCRLYDEARR